MNNKEKLYFKRLLNEWLNELTAKINVMTPSENQEQLPEIIERASYGINRDFAVRMQERDYYLIGKVRRALQKIENGSYGICEECGKKIPIARLKVRPVTTLCIKCKQEQETAERMFA